MVKRIVWTSRADTVFTKILEYYCQRNQSKTYSRKLNKEIHQIIKLIAKYPLLGMKTDIDSIRVLIKKQHKIFYEVKANEIVVHLVWDTRQNPKTLKI
ncbi:type II toxin-antitoxin system RelE/ParE family toxin [Flagellimonas sp.]|uniref:type II toxin-antitoxin system RelE/ParE family toxin n=1 Tax=Flagellimonas sp. TaxID=2058762 RepID=UPI003B501BAD